MINKLGLVIIIFGAPVFSQCDWNNDGNLDILDIVETLNCILTDCWSNAVWGCTDPFALNYDPEATLDDGSCEYSGDPILDIDGNVYHMVIIGSQEWLVENLRVTHYRNGDLIPSGISASDWPELDVGAFALYGNDSTLTETYGYLYNWHAVNDERGIAPEGWHVASEDDFNELELFLGIDAVELDQTGWLGDNEGGMLKEAGTDHWSAPNQGATNETGFTALPGESRDYETGQYMGMTNVGHFWTSTLYSPFADGYAWGRGLSFGTAAIYRNYHPLRTGYSVRCVRDN